MDNDYVTYSDCSDTDLIDLDCTVTEVVVPKDSLYSAVVQSVL